MTEMTQAPPVADEQSTTEQAKEKVQETAGQVQQQIGEKAQQMRGQAADTIREQLDSRSTQAGEQVAATADAMRRVGGMLVAEGNGAPGQYAERAAEPLDRLGRYLNETDGEQILRDAERLARQRPWAAVLGGATLGFLVARFIKASGGANDGAATPGGPYGQAAIPAAPATGGGFDGDSGQ